MAQLYQKLDEGCFRLLCFDDDSGLSCALQVHPMHEAPLYMALSYTWGPAIQSTHHSTSPERFITLDGDKFAVQDNLFDALQHLAKYVNSRSCLFWVDAICINQSDLKERSAQVKHMKLIYENASYIFAWLGLPDDDKEVSLAIKMMARFNQHLQTGGDLDAALESVNTEHSLFPADKTSDTWTAWEGITKMFDRTYWQRTWIYQEATTPGEIYFFCGSHSFDDVYLSAAVTFGMRFSRRADFDPRFVAACGQASNAAALCSARVQRGKGLRRGLIDLVSEMRLTHCTDHRDKVLAALGHAADPARLRITVDYEKTVSDVYLDVACAALAQPQDSGLSLLGHVFSRPDDTSNWVLTETFEPTLPSWVPDWRQRVSIPPISKFHDLYDPCPGSIVDTQARGEELHVKGLVFNDLYVATLTCICDDVEPRIDTPRKWYNEFMEAASEASKESLDVAIRRSLVADKVWSNNAVGENSSSVSRWNRGGMVDRRLVDHRDPSFDDNAESSLDDMNAICHGRRMAMLRDGSIAVLPAAARRGDQIAAFFGAKALFLVRALGSQGLYSLVGECYVDGYMDGALMEEVHGGCRPPIFIRLI